MHDALKDRAIGKEAVQRTVQIVPNGRHRLAEAVVDEIVHVACHACSFFANVNQLCYGSIIPMNATDMRNVTQ